MVASRRRPGSVHDALATKLGEAIHVGNPPEVREGVREYLSTQPGLDPEDVIVYVYGVTTAWCVLAVGFSLLSVALAFVGDQIDGPSGRTVGLTIGMAACFFCLTGAVNAIWRQVFAYKARRCYRRHGLGDPRCRRTADRALPRNSSLIAQTAVALLVVFIVIHTS